MARAILFPEKPVTTILREFKLSILKDFKFCFAHFMSEDTLPPFSELPQEKQASIKTFEQILKNMILELGGTVTEQKMLATHFIFSIPKLKKQVSGVRPN